MLKIPESHKAPLTALATMDKVVRQRLLNAVRSTEAVIDPKEFIAQIQKQSGVAEGKIDTIITMLLSLYRASGAAHSGFVEDVVEAAQGVVDPAERDAIDWPSFSKDLTDLLASHESLGVTAKVLEIRTEYGNVYCSARIVSDVRSVFSLDPTQVPLAAAVVHSLKIVYHTGRDHIEFYVAMDLADLQEVGALVERAIKKEAALRKVIEKTGMKYLEPRTI